MERPHHSQSVTHKTHIIVDFDMRWAAQQSIVLVRLGDKRCGFVGVVVVGGGDTLGGGRWARGLDKRA